MAGLDTNTKFLTHLNGADEATSATDVSDSAHTITFNGTAQLDTAQKKWGTASLLLDGDSDYLTVPDSTDWDIIGTNSESWTVDFWVKHADHTGQECYFSQYEDGNNYYMFRHDNGFGMFFYAASGGSAIIVTSKVGEITDTNWHHIALIIVGTGATKNIGIYKDGIQVGYLQDNSTATFAGTFFIGAESGPGSLLDGHMDEVRVQKSNYFSASPNVGLTDTITVPTAEYSRDRASVNRAMIIT